MATSDDSLLAEKVYLDIKNRILSGEYLPGKHLVEATLTDELKVSRVTIRDALRRLVADELAVSNRNRGVEVRQLSSRDVVELYALRGPLEGLAAKIAAENPVGDTGALKTLCLQCAAAASVRDLVEHRRLNYEFHRMIATLTGNSLLIKTIERLNIQIVANQFMLYMCNMDLDRSKQAHEEILEAVLAHDGNRAEQVMHRHVEEGREFALSCVALKSQ